MVEKKQFISMIGSRFRLLYRLHHFETAEGVSSMSMRQRMLDGGIKCFRYDKLQTSKARIQTHHVWFKKVSLKPTDT
jgi:hypothetical protein